MIAWIKKWINFWVFRLSLFLHPRRRLPPRIRTADEIYTTPRIARFQRKFATLSDANIDAWFHRPYAEYWKHVCDKDNALERRWRQRLIMEFTPRGLVIMYYDAYKRGFAYYADTYMPYGILNVVAMKYASTYQCRALFTDEEYFPEGHVSPIHVLDQADAETTMSPPPPSKNKSSEGPFLKQRPTTVTTATMEQPPKRKNRFLSLGKIVNCQVLPPGKNDNNLTPLPTATAAASTTSYKFWRQQSSAAASVSEVFAQSCTDLASARFATMSPSFKS
jgi:hypothetical protein